MADTTYYAIQGLRQRRMGSRARNLHDLYKHLARTTIYASSAGGVVVPLSAGSKYVFITQPAARAVYVVGTDIVAANGATLPAAIVVRGRLLLRERAAMCSQTIRYWLHRHWAPSIGCGNQFNGNGSGFDKRATRHNAATAADVVGVASRGNVHQFGVSLRQPCHQRCDWRSPKNSGRLRLRRLPVEHTWSINSPQLSRKHQN